MARTRIIMLFARDALGKVALITSSCELSLCNSKLYYYQTASKVKIIYTPFPTTVGYAPSPPPHPNKPGLSANGYKERKLVEITTYRFTKILALYIFYSCFFFYSAMIYLHSKEKYNIQYMVDISKMILYFKIL